MAEKPYVHGAGEPDQSTVLFSPEAKAVVDDWLAGIELVRDGTMDMFFIERTDHSGEIVTPDIVNETEAHIRNDYSPYYPELIEFGKVES